MTQLKTLAAIALTTSAIAWIAIGIVAAEPGGTDGPRAPSRRLRPMLPPTEAGRATPGGRRRPEIHVAVVQSKAATLRSRPCRIGSHRHIEVRAPEAGYLQRS